MNKIVKIAAALLTIITVVILVTYQPQPTFDYYWREYVNCVPFNVDRIKENLDRDECGTGQWTHAYYDGLDCEVIEHGTKSELLIRQEQFHFNYCKALMEATKNE